jgi:hypothetical protein
MEGIPPDDIKEHERQKQGKQMQGKYYVDFFFLSSHIVT